MLEQEPEEDITKDPSQLFWPVAGTVVIFLVQYVIMKDVVTAILFAICAIAYIAVCLAHGSISFEYKAFRMDLLTPNEDKFYTAGMYFVWWPFQRLVKVQTEPVRIDVEKQEVITDEKDGDSKAAIGADAFVYLYTPSNAPDLIKFYKYAPDIKPEKNGGEEFSKFFKPHIVSMIRRVSGSSSWSSIQKDDKKFKEGVHEAILHGDEDNPMKKAGIPTIQVSFERLDLGELSKNITNKQIAEFKLQATMKEAEGKKYTKEKEGEGDAAATASKGTAEVAIKKKRLEAMSAHPEMAQIDVYREASEKAGNIILSLDASTRDAISKKGGVDNMLGKVSIPVLMKFLNMTEEDQKEALKAFGGKKSKPK